MNEYAFYMNKYAKHDLVMALGPRR